MATVQSEQRRTAPYTYESSEVFLSMVQADYQSGIERASSIDTKLSISLPIFATYLFSLAQFSSLGNLLEPIESGIFRIIISLLYAITLLCAVISLVLMVVSVSLHNYESMNMRRLNSAEQMSLPKEQYCAAIASMYINLAFSNTLLNNRRASLHNWGWVIGVVSIVCFITLVLAAG